MRVGTPGEVRFDIESICSNVMPAGCAATAGKIVCQRPTLDNDAVAAKFTFTLKAPPRYAMANVLVHSEIVPDTHILVRGDFKQKGPKVEPGFLSALGGGTVSESAER